MKLSALLKKPLWLYTVVSLLAVLLMAAVSAIWAPQLQQWEERLTGRTWSLANPDATERRVVVVDIDEKSTQALGPWPWPRERVATLLSGLDAYGVNLKVVDVLFEGAQDPAQDQKLAAALKSGAPTVISQLFALNPQAQLRSGQLAGSMGTCTNNGTPAYGFMGAESLLAQSSAGVGHITPIVDTDGNIPGCPRWSALRVRLTPRWPWPVWLPPQVSSRFGMLAVLLCSATAAPNNWMLVACSCH